MQCVQAGRRRDRRRLPYPVGSAEQSGAQERPSPSPFHVSVISITVVFTPVGALAATKTFIAAASVTVITAADGGGPRPALHSPGGVTPFDGQHMRPCIMSAGVYLSDACPAMSLSSPWRERELKDAVRPARAA